ncbi:MAG: radical SAM protein [Candidatus Omnitrophota bacterium]
MRVIFVIRHTGEGQIGIMSLSGVLKQRGHRVEIVEAGYKKIKERLRAGHSAILAYSTPTRYADYYIQLNRRIKREFDVFSVFGGPHPTAVPEITEEEGVDGVCRGEGELAMAELADNLSNGKSVRDIKNWWIKEDGKIYRNPPRPLIENLDELPFPDRELFRKLPLFDEEKIHIITGRGCPYDCSYCFNPVYNRLYEGKAGKIRRRSVCNVIEEIRQAQKRFPLKFLVFDDDLFVLPYEWIKEFSRHYKKEVGLPFFCYLRADLVNPEIIRHLKGAGCFSISMGIETADDNLRNFVLKRNMSKEQIIGAAREIKNNRIRLKASNIIGIPGGSLEADIETAGLNARCSVDYSSVEILTPYPGTEIYKLIIDSGAVDKDNYWSKDYKGLRNRPELVNFQMIFALTVEFPVLFTLVRILLRLPAIRLYNLFYLLWEGYCAYFRLYPSGLRGFLRGIKKYIKLIKK